MMLRIGPGNYNSNNYNVRNNKAAQGQPAFGAKINPEDVIKIAKDTGITDVQGLGDMADWINDRGLKHFMGSHMYKGQIKNPEMKPALEKLIKIAQSDE